MVRPISFHLVVLAAAALAFAPAQGKEPPKPAFLGVQLAAGKAGGVVVRVVLADSPAEKAGLKGGDRIVSIGGAKPANLRAAVAAIRSLKPGRKVKLLIDRDGKEKTIEAVPASAD